MSFLNQLFLTWTFFFQEVQQEEKAWARRTGGRGAHQPPSGAARVHPPRRRRGGRERRYAFWEWRDWERRNGIWIGGHDVVGIDGDTEQGGGGGRDDGGGGEEDGLTAGQVGNAKETQAKQVRLFLINILDDRRRHDWWLLTVE